MHGSYTRFMMNSAAVARSNNLSEERAQEYNRRLAALNSEGFTAATAEEHGRKLEALDKEFGIGR